MADDLSPIAPVAEGTAPETLAKADAMYEKLGYSAEARAAAGLRPAATEKPAAAPPPFAAGDTRPAPDPQHVPPATQAGHLSYETKLAALVKLQGVVDDATIIAAAKAEGINPADLKMTAPAAEAANITLAEANARLQAAGDPALAPGNSPVDYDFTFDRNEIDGLDAQEVADLSRMYKDAFFEAKLPMASTQAIVRESISTMNRLADLSDAARELEMRNQGAILKRSGDINEIVRYAELALSRMPETFRNEMYERHAFSSAEAYAALASAGRLIEAREARQGKK